MKIEKILEMAKSQIGIKEQPANSNKVKFNTEYYGKEVSGSAYPWCCVFVWWVFKHCESSGLFYDGKKTAYCPEVERFYKKCGQWYSDGKAGDLVLFDFNNKGKAGHIGIVEKVNLDGSYTTIEGNTGSGNDANGGAVMRRTRYASSIRGFARPKYEEEDETMTQAEKKEMEQLKIRVEELEKNNTVYSICVICHSYLFSYFEEKK